MSTTNDQGGEYQSLGCCGKPKKTVNSVEFMISLFFRYLRTPSLAVVSEGTVCAYLRKSIFRMFSQKTFTTMHFKLFKSPRSSSAPSYASDNTRYPLL